MIRKFFATACVLVMAAGGALLTRGAESHYQTVENWARFPDGFTAWSPVSGVDLGPEGNIYVFQRNAERPIMAFDANGKFLRAWGKGLFKTPHFLRTDREGNVWVTDRGDHQVFKFSAEGKLLMTLGQKGVSGTNESRDAFFGVADLVIASNGDVFIADGESGNHRIVQYSKAGQFVRWWGGRGSQPGQFNEPHSIAIDATGLLYVGDRGNKRIQVFDQTGKFIREWTHFGTPWGVFARSDRLYVVDGTEANCLYIANLQDGTIIDKVEGLKNATAVTVDAQGVIYIGEVNGANVRKLVPKR